MDVVDMTASELLRWAAERNSATGRVPECTLCQEAFSLECSDDVSCERWCLALADKIDAELAQVHAADLRDLAAIWAVTNGWPGFREGETFGAWLERCAYKKPVDDCNEPVQFGDEIELHYRSGGMDKGRLQEVTVNNWSVWLLSFTGVDHAREYRYNREFDTIKRPAPEVLGADGKPIVTCETVYPTYGSHIGEPCKVLAVLDQDNVRVSVPGGGNERFDGCYLAHTPPDTQERIDADVLKLMTGYWDCSDFKCAECPSKVDGATPSERYNSGNGFIGCREAMIFDLLRRQRELDKRTGGAE
ncbi:hypothetical protein VJ923_06080 [Adlercreutzia sp. R25]|uniref:hypothetical protein n=1 Tax=Adlercreutzia shanghongiae TaxID=3111773 RepID=UPI002DBE1B0D|nr:hypothetical protein [Adlercreutzia sp. R25]MEC4272720.1 hypothetical protein [Adlercreutzia sp. R25]